MRLGLEQQTAASEHISTIISQDEFDISLLAGNTDQANKLRNAVYGLFEDLGFLPHNTFMRFYRDVITETGRIDSAVGMAQVAPRQNISVTIIDEPPTIYMGAHLAEGHAQLVAAALTTRFGAKDFQVTIDTPQLRR